MAVLARSFARIHETNLKKQGIVPLVFRQVSDYDRLRGGDRLSLPLATQLRPAAPLRVSVWRPATGERFDLEVTHSMNELHVQWFWAGSALNRMATQQQKEKEK